MPLVCALVVMLYNTSGEHVTVVSKVIDSPTHPAFEVLYKQLLSAKVLQGPDQASTSEASEPEDVQEDDVEDGAYIEDGCCVMCEREMPLTKHHLIPRETHYWYVCICSFVKFLKVQKASRDDPQTVTYGNYGLSRVPFCYPFIY